MNLKKIIPHPFLSLIMPFLSCIFFLTGCSEMYDAVREKAGATKRDILVERVEKTQVAQNDAQEQFKSALDLFEDVVNIDSNLKDVYKQINAEYLECLSSANIVSERIELVESISENLFKEWIIELDMYQNQSLKWTSQQRLRDATQKYSEMLASMHQSEDIMTQVLYIFRDNVLFLKHNLNAQAIGALRNEFSMLEIEIDHLIEKMNTSIASSNKFIEEMKRSVPYQ